MKQIKGIIFAINFVSTKILVDVFPPMLLIASSFLFLLCKILKLDLEIPY
jgi:hypothetical protein